MTSQLAPTYTLNKLDWTWQGHRIRYTVEGQGQPMVLLHGFGASMGHWRKNIPVLAEQHRVYAIDLLGFGQSAKPTPGDSISYTFETWGQQLIDFCQEVIQAPAFLVGNSIGCVAILQAAVMAPEQVQGLIAMNCSLRLLHDRKRMTLPWYRRYSAPILQKVLAYQLIGNYFFSRLARAEVVRKILLQAYARKEAVTDELVELLLQPAADTGAAAVFLAFTAYSQGPLPEDLLPQLACPALLLWGEDDPWEPVTLGRELANFPAVEQFIELPGVGHCPQDEAPELVNPIIQDWVAQKVTPQR